MRALIALVIGIMMVVSPANALTTVVKIIAAFMLASGVVSLVVGLKDKEKGSLPLMSFNALADLILGLLMFIFPGVIAKFMIYLIGFVLLAFGIVQILALISARRAVGMGFGAFILPIIVTCIGGFILFNPFAESVMSTIAGVALMIYGASELLSSWKMKQAVDEYETHNPDIDNQDVDEQ